MICSGCGWTVPAGARPFRCRNAGRDDVDHVLTRRVDPGPDPFLDDDPDPFVRYRRLTHTWHDALARGVSDEDFIDVVGRLEDRIEAVDGRRFAVTPLEPRLGAWIKDETSNVAGSHKARHLMGVLIWLETMSRFDGALADAPLAIASCGNAAVAAAVLARAARRTLDVFVPAGVSPEIVDRIEAHGARVRRCTRVGGRAGDPSVPQFREAVAAGALPFTCQGNENGLAIEGGSTLGWEIVTQLVTRNRSVDRLFIQTGGGALASAVIAAFDDAVAAAVLPRLPRIYAVQTTASSPLARAWERMREPGIDYAIRHRSEFMWPWGRVPASIAGGILDDETYDWVAVVRGMHRSGGHPILVSEEQLLDANRLAGPTVSATGSAGLAGALQCPSDESTVVIFTGSSLQNPLATKGLCAHGSTRD
jgi:threonine synthase